MNLIRNSETSLAFLLVIVTLTLGGRIPQKSDSSSKRGLDIDKVPQNTAVYAGATVTLTCWVSGQSENPRVQWTEFAYNDNGQLISDADFILPAHPQSDRYSLVREDPLQYDLVIANVNVNDGGIYSCYDANAQVTDKQRAAAQLIVIAGPQNCTGTIPESGDVMEGHYHTVECTIDYGGGIIPNGRWSGPQPFGQAQSSTDERVWSGMSFYAHRTMRGQSWTSKFNFTNNFLPVPVDTAENIPDFENTFDTTRLNVFWSPQNMYADPMNDEYQVGDLITCYADAFPIASFEWHNLRTNERYPGSVFTVTQDYEGTSQTMRCQAVNTINDLPYSNDLYISVNVPGPTTTPTTTTPTTTTTPPPVSSCFNLTGRWESVGPTPAYMCLEVLSETGNIHGVLRNDTDTFWVDLIGLSEPNTYDHASFTGIWPLNRAVSTFIGECSRCHGVEHLLINAISRSKGGPPCATPGQINYSLQYDFLRNPDIACPPITIPENTFEK